MSNWTLFLYIQLVAFAVAGFLKGMAPEIPAERACETESFLGT
jgi:hypothetical protein